MSRNLMRLLSDSLVFVIGYLANTRVHVPVREGERRTFGRVRANCQLFWMLRPHERPNFNATDVLVIDNTFLEFFRQRVDPLESSFLEAGLLGFFGVVSDSPDHTSHFGDFVYATGETNGDYLLYRPGLSRS